GREGNRIERSVPGARGVLEQGDLLRLAIDDPGAGAVDGVDAVALGVGRLVAADPGLQLQMPDHRLDDRPRHQRCTCVVEVDPVPAAGCVVANCVGIDAHGPTLDVTVGCGQKVTAMPGSVDLPRTKGAAANGTGSR